MSETNSPVMTIEKLLPAPLLVGEPQSVRNLTLFPLFGGKPRCEYVGLARARERGARIGELAQQASVNDLLVENLTGSKLLLFEGEEVLGAQQNRTFDVSVLVKERSTVKVPVSCVEAGRWDGSRHMEGLACAPQAANPRVRRLKAEDSRREVLAGREARANQGAVWSEVSAMAAAHGVTSATDASHDVFEGRRAALDEMCRHLALQPAQVGAIAAINGKMCVLDLVSRPEVYADLHARLCQGYALDALGEPTALGVSADPATARGFALMATDAPVEHRKRGVCLGHEIRFASGGVAGTGLAYRRELIQLTAFPAGQRASRVAAPLRASAREAP